MSRFVCNLFWGNHFADLLNFGRSQTASLVSRPKFSKNYESTTAITSIVIRCTNQIAIKLSLQGFEKAETIHKEQNIFPLPCGWGLRGWVKTPFKRLSLAF